MTLTDSDGEMDSDSLPATGCVDSYEVDATNEALVGAAGAPAMPLCAAVDLSP